ncbi:DUF2169 domain-containing protein [Archangium gephyra]|uniref:DUF2169 family type VI secretion system accessory protein n=1 Tax=Archangium gephyra TaxID=48 RepID=UPI0035D4D40A
MQISSNTTAMQAGIALTTDKEARDHCVVVIKGTFTFDKTGEPRIAEMQRTLVYSDEHHGDPGTTSIRYECDFASQKPRADVLVHGHAIARGGRPVERMLVRLELPGRHKDLLVTGDRRWEKGLLGLSSTPPQPFTRMPLLYERAFGGSDHSHQDLKHQGTEPRNPVGMGFRKNPQAADSDGVPLPNVENPKQPLQRWNDTPTPVGFGSVGRAWQPRRGYAGTYDKQWLDSVYPFLPADFDPRYFQCAPEDQQLPILKGGELLRCLGMTESGSWTVMVPRVQVPVTFCFHDRKVESEPRLDTMLLDCDTREAVLTWRVSVPLSKKLNQLREVLVGVQSPPISSEPVEYRNGKPYFRGLAALISWQNRHRPRGGA